MDVIRELAVAGAELDARNKEMASSAGYQDIVQLLDEHREGKKLFDIF